jgi:hypothetical protein
MTRTEAWSGLESAPRWILMFTGAYLCLGLFTFYVWTHAAPTLSMQPSPGDTEALSITGMAAAQAWLCLLALRSFQPGAPLRRAWFLIMLSAATHVVGGLFGQVPGTASQIHRIAPLLSGPVQMGLLAAGLLVALRTLWKFGFWARPKATGWAVAGILILFTLSRPAGDSISLARNLLVCVLSVEALFLWLSAARMGRGLIAKCWRAFAIGIFAIGFGEAALWVIGSYFPAWLVAALEWYVWFPAAAAFALAPARSVAAVRRATGRVTQPASDRPVAAFPRTVPAN